MVRKTCLTCLCCIYVVQVYIYTVYCLYRCLIFGEMAGSFVLQIISSAKYFETFDRPRQATNVWAVMDLQYFHLFDFVFMCFFFCFVLFDQPLHPSLLHSANKFYSKASYSSLANLH